MFLALENDLGAIQWRDHGFGHGTSESPAQQGVHHRPAGPQVLLRHHSGCVTAADDGHIVITAVRQVTL